MSPLKITIITALLTLSAYARDHHDDSRFSPRHDAHYEMKRPSHHSYSHSPKHHYVNNYRPHHRPASHHYNEGLEVVSALALGVFLGAQMAHH